jgi:hypothetical protein
LEYAHNDPRFFQGESDNVDLHTNLLLLTLLDFSTAHGIIQQRCGFSGERVNIDKIELLILLLDLKIVRQNENYKDRCFGADRSELSEYLGDTLP